MPDRIARVWTGSQWEIITSNSPSPNAVATYQSASPSGPITGQVWIDSDDNTIFVWNGSSWSSAISNNSVIKTIYAAKGDLVTASASGEPIRLAVGTNGQVLTASSSATGGLVWAPATAGATGGGTDQVFYNNDQTVTTNYSIPSGKNSMSAGPVTINNGVTVTIPSGSVWSII